MKEKVDMLCTYGTKKNKMYFINMNENGVILGSIADEEKHICEWWDLYLRKHEWDYLSCCEYWNRWMLCSNEWS